jgi:hypothetical protein
MSKNIMQVLVKSGIDMRQSVAEMNAAEKWGPEFEMTAEEVADVRADAREYLEQHGWVARKMYSHTGAACGMGAVGISQNWWQEFDYEDETESGFISPMAQLKCNQVLAAVVLLGLGSKDQVGLENSAGAFVEWNDNRAQSQQEVLDLFAKTEKILRAGYDPDAS